MLLGRVDISAFQALVNVRKTEIVNKPEDTPSKNEGFVRNFDNFVVEMEENPILNRPEYRGDPWGRPTFVSSTTEKTEYDVVLKESGTERLRVISELKKLYDGFTWKDAKNLADKTPVVIAERVSRERAEEIQNTFAFIGANIEIK